MWTYQHNTFQVHQIPVLRDNYIYLIQDCHSDTVLIIDPALAKSTQQACDKLKLTPTHILNTHHHWDHTDGNIELMKLYNCTIVGNKYDTSRIPGISHEVDPNTSLRLGNFNIQVIDVPGHTLGHIAFIIDDALFCGDTLFGAGCGRLFEGSYEQMWCSLQQLAALDEKTKVYCAHEYTLPNLRFAYDIDCENNVLLQRMAHDKKIRENKRPTIPSSIGLEKQTNPFLRPMDENFRQYFNKKNQQNFDAFQMFKNIREQKNNN